MNRQVAHSRVHWFRFFVGVVVVTRILAAFSPDRSKWYTPDGGHCFRTPSGKLWVCD